jgi:hypothetical protein
MGNFLKFGYYRTIIISQMATEIFQLLEKGACHMFFKTFLQKLYKNIWKPPFVAIEKIWLPSKK